LRRLPNFSSHFDFNVLNTRETFHKCHSLVAHLIFDRTCRRREIQVEKNLPRLDFQVTDEAERYDVFVQIRILDPL
jgi:hypothetical protein